MEMLDIHNLIKEGSRKRAEESLVGLRSEIEAKAAELDKEKAKVHSLEIEIRTRDNKRAELSSSLMDMENVKQYIEVAKYEEAKKTLMDGISSATLDRDKLAGEFDELRSKVAGSSRDIDKLRDKMTLLTNPNHKPRYSENEASIDLFLEECRKEIRGIYDECRLLPNKIMEISDFVEMGLIMRLAGGNIRKKNEQLVPLNSAEEYVFGKCYSLLGRLANDNKLGYVDPLNRKYNQNWAWYAAEQKRLLIEHQAKRRREAAGGGKRRYDDDEDADAGGSKEETILMEALVECGLHEKMSGKKVAVYGGKTRVDVAFWLENALKLKKLSWYEYQSNNNVRNLTESIKNGGVDMLVVMTQWMAHKHNGIIDDAKSGNVHVALCGSGGKKEICMQMAYAMGCRLDEAIRRLEVVRQEQALPT
jgi:predicted  nucleic acid-binding Zn-ribbon protein